LIVRLTANRETAEEVTIDVFHDIWRHASRYDAATGTVLAWIMNQARSRAIDRLRYESRKKRSSDDDLGSRLNQVHQMIVAAMATAAAKLLASLS